MRMAILAGIITVIAGFFVGGTLSVNLNWPDAATVVSIAVMGGLILHKIDQTGKDK